ncbi:hypothetical protein SPHINGO391_470210 [Sphingomonas aurantiaca]|uniref:Uncharacterized protein n=1 Tax=Sphingomonas aurantiaca TaxID=185949 RepID=A0A5E7ZQM5_9SPHN|nr:hypothetical protein SPHINGO391_470210 [Sphingomonas aurantiaca]
MVSFRARGCTILTNRYMASKPVALQATYDLTQDDIGSEAFPMTVAEAFRLYLCSRLSYIRSYG